MYSSWPIESYGPVVFRPEDGSEVTAKCYFGGIACRFHLRGTCAYFQPSRKKDAGPDTPDWCELKASRIEEAQEPRTPNPDSSPEATQ